MKVAIFFDLFAEMGGAERVAILTAKELKADIYTTYVDWNNSDKELQKLNVNQIGLTFKNAKLLTFSEIAWRFSKLKVPNYDIYLFSRSFCISAGINHHPNIWFATAPVRSINDLHDFVYQKLSLWQKPIFKTWCSIYKLFDKKWVFELDKIIANSKNSADRFKKFYNLNVPYMHSPIEFKAYRNKGYEDFYLAPGRQTKEKRTDLIINAFKEMPDKKLLVIGNGPERKNLEKLANENKNIKFLGAINFKDWIDLFSRCTATIYMPFNEDFGLIPIESNASGKPCIAANEGGCKETIIHGKTGYLIKPNKEEIKKYVKLVTPEKAKLMKKKCINRAKQFDVKTYIKELKEHMGELVGR